MGALNQHSMPAKPAESAPILVLAHPVKGDATLLPRHYGGFAANKQRWASAHQRSHRIQYIACLQLTIGVLSSWNYLWATNLFSCFVGLVGILSYKSEKMSWTLVYLLVCMMECMRLVLLAPHLMERHSIPLYTFSAYENFQLVLLFVQGVFLVPGAFGVVIAAAAGVSNPLW